MSIRVTRFGLAAMLIYTVWSEAGDCRYIMRTSTVQFGITSCSVYTSGRCTAGALVCKVRLHNQLMCYWYMCKFIDQLL